VPAAYLLPLSPPHTNKCSRVGFFLSAASHQSLLRVHQVTIPLYETTEVNLLVELGPTLAMLAAENRRGQAGDDNTGSRKGQDDSPILNSAGLTNLFSPDSEPTLASRLYLFANFSHFSHKNSGCVFFEQPDIFLQKKL
jgi:hypothetical protein